MSNSILNEIKKLLGIAEEYTHYDTDIIIHINSVFSILEDFGVCKVSNYHITGSDNLWDEVVEDKTVEFVKTYIYMRVKLIFDPPSTSFVITSYENLIKELEWRMTNKMKEVP